MRSATVGSEKEKTEIASQEDKTGFIQEED